jgi:hypothetical protein
LKRRRWRWRKSATESSLACLLHPAEDGGSKKSAEEAAAPGRRHHDVAEVFQTLALVFQESDKEGSTFAKEAKEEELVRSLVFNGTYVSSWLIKDISQSSDKMFRISVEPTFALASASSNRRTRQPSVVNRFEKMLPVDFARRVVAGDRYIMIGTITVEKQGRSGMGWDRIGTFSSPTTGTSYSVNMKTDVYDIDLQNPPK